MMQKTWQIIRTELRRKWVLIAASIAVWLLACLAVFLGARRYYGGPGTGDVPYDIVGLMIGLTIALYTLIFGASLFEAGEKDGIRCFLYHHPVSRFQLYLVRYLTGAAIVTVLSCLTAVFTPLLFGKASWSQLLLAMRKLSSDDTHSVLMVLLIFSIFYGAAAFFSPLLATELITVPLAAAYGGIAAVGLVFFGAGGPPQKLVPLSALWALLAGDLVIFSCGLQLFCKRTILESSWSRRGAVALGFFGITIIVLLVVNFVDFVDLLYLLGIDLMAWG